MGVGGEAGVPVNPEQRAPRGTWISHEEGADPGEMRREAADEQEGGLDNHLLVSHLVLGEPFAIVVPPKLAQELEQLRTEERTVTHGDVE